MPNNKISREQLQAENEKLKEIQRRYQALLKVQPLKTFIIDKTGFYFECYSQSSDTFHSLENKKSRKDISKIGLSAEDKKNILLAVEKAITSDQIQKVQYTQHVLEGEGTYEAQITKLDSVYAIGVVRPIKKDKGISKPLNKTEKKYIEIGKNFPGLFYQFLRKQDGAYYVSFICKNLNPLYDVTAKATYNENHNLFELIHKEDISSVEKSINRSEELQQKWLHEFRIVLANDEVRSIFGISAPRENENGTKIWNGLLVDITEEKKIGKNLFRTKEELKLTFENSPIGVCTTDLSGKFLSTNKSYCKMMGYLPEELKSKTFFDLTHSSYKKLNRDFLEQLAKGDKPYDQLQKKNVRKSGELVDVYIRAQLVKDESGKPLFVIAVVEDITKRKLAETNSRLTEEQFRKLSTSSPTGILIYQKDKWQYANPRAEKISGYSLEELRTMNFWDFVHPDHISKVKKQGKDRQKGKLAKYNYELRIITKQGKTKWVELFGTNIIYNNRKAGLVSVLDITKKKTNEKVQQVLLNIAELALHYTNINQLSQAIFSELKSIIPTGCFYIALYNPQTNKYTFPINIDPYDKYDPDNEFSLKHSLTDYVRKTGKSSLITETKFNELRKTQKVKSVGEPSPVWMGAPIVDPDSSNTIGIIAMQDYEDETAFHHSDLKILEIISRNVGAVIQKIKTEEELHKSEEKFRTLAESIPGVATIYETYSDGTRKSIYEGPGLAQIIGSKKAEEIKDNIDRYFEMIPDADKEKLEAEAIEALNRDKLLDCEYRLKISPHEFRWIRSRFNVKRLENNGFRWEGLIYDITARKRAIDKLKKSEAKFRTFFEESLDAVFQTSSDGKFLDMNQAGLDLFGYSRQEMKNINVSTTYANPQDRNSFKEIMSQEGSVKDFEVNLKRKDGAEFPVIISARAIRSETGEIIGYEGIIHDITVQKKAEKVLKNAAEEKEILLKEAHHRIKNNFTIVSAILNMQSRNIKDADDLKMFKESQDRVMLMANLHESLYKSSDTSNVDMKMYLTKIIDDLCKGYDISKSNINIVKDLEQIFIPSKTATHCGLLVNEIFTNAYKYGFPQKKSGEIGVSLKKIAGSEIVLCVYNNGAPRPDDFNPEDSSTLGMQLVDMLVNQIDGKLEISQHEKTEFKITFNYLNL